MKHYYVKFSFEDPYPKEYATTEQGSNHAVAISRAFRKFRKDVAARKKIRTLKIFSNQL